MGQLADMTSTYLEDEDKQDTKDKVGWGKVSEDEQTQVVTPQTLLIGHFMWEGGSVGPCHTDGSPQANSPEFPPFSSSGTPGVAMFLMFLSSWFPFSHNRRCVLHLLSHL